jgi:hypothetical protein
VGRDENLCIVSPFALLHHGALSGSRAADSPPQERARRGPPALGQANLSVGHGVPTTSDGRNAITVSRRPTRGRSSSPRADSAPLWIMRFVACFAAQCPVCRRFSAGSTSGSSARRPSCGRRDMVWRWRGAVASMTPAVHIRLTMLPNAVYCWHPRAGGIVQQGCVYLPRPSFEWVAAGGVTGRHGPGTGTK